jgi:subtilase family serine protease
VLTAGAVQVPPGHQDQRFRFVASQAMAPYAHLIIYYVRPENGEIIADAVDFSVSGMLQNFVRWSNKKATQLNFNVNSKF